MVEEHQVRTGRSHYARNLLQFALPHQGGRIRTCAALHQGCRNLRARAARQLLELGKQCVEVEAANRTATGFPIGRRRDLVCGGRLFVHVRANRSRVPRQTRRRAQPPSLSGKLHRNQHGELVPRRRAPLRRSSAGRCRIVHKAHLRPPGHVASSRTGSGLVEASLVFMNVAFRFGISIAR